MALVTEILDTIDESVRTTGQAMFEQTASALGPTVTILMTLLIALIGLNMAIGAYRLSAKDAMQMVTRIVMIYVFALSWANFGQIYDALSNASASIAMGFFDVAGGLTSPGAAMDTFAANMADTADGVAKSMSSIMRGVLGAVFYVVLSLLMAVYVLVVGFAKIMIAFLLGVAPIAMIATIFDKTKNLFEAWLSALIGYLMYPIAAAGVIGTVVTVAQKQFAKQEEVSNIGQLLGFFVVVFVGILALRAIPQAASAITGQFNLASITPEAMRTVSRPLTAAGGRLTSPAAAMAEGFAHKGQTAGGAKKARERTMRERGAEMRKKFDTMELLSRK